MKQPARFCNSWVLNDAIDVGIVLIFPGIERYINKHPDFYFVILVNIQRTNSVLMHACGCVCVWGGVLYMYVCVCVFVRSSVP